jgi:nitric oxide reductase NorE protein
MKAQALPHPLPGNLMMWVLVGSEMLVFGAALAGFAVARLLHPQAFHDGHLALEPMAATLNTLALLTSGWFAARAVARASRGEVRAVRRELLVAGLFGLIFMAVKIAEYAVKLRAGIGLETSVFFTLYYLITGFHLAHVVFGLIILAVVARYPAHANVETGVIFWHMVDLVWVLIFPVIYLVA